MHRLEIKLVPPDKCLASLIHFELIKETEAYLNASDICYALIDGNFIIISDKCKLHVFVGYSLPPSFCVFDYCLILIYTGLFI